MAATRPQTRSDQRPDVHDLEQRTVRALTEFLVILEDAPGLYTVYSEDGTERYSVGLELGACTCEDARFRDPEGGCKHLRRVRYATGEWELEDWVNLDAVDPALAEKIRARRQEGDDR